MHTEFKKRVVTVGTTSAQQTFFHWDELGRGVSVVKYMKTRTSTFSFVTHLNGVTNIIRQKATVLYSNMGTISRS